MERVEYDVAWLDEMRQRDDVRSFAGEFRQDEESCMHVLLEVACQPEDVLRVLDDEERRTRIAFEDALVATGFVKRAKVAFGCLAVSGEEGATDISVWIVPSLQWEAFAYWAEDGLSRRNDVLQALGCALGEAFGVAGQFIDRQLETLGEMLSLAYDFPFIMSDIGQTAEAAFSTFEWSTVFEDIRGRCRCTLEVCSLDFGTPAWQSLLNMPFCGYSSQQKHFFKDERSLAEDYFSLEASLASLRSSRRGGMAYVVVFEVFAFRPSFGFIADPQQSDVVAALERALVSVGFCRSASFSVETFLGKVVSRLCVVRAVVDAEDSEDARDMPFAFHRDIVDAFRRTCGCWVVELRPRSLSVDDILPHKGEY